MAQVPTPPSEEAVPQRLFDESTMVLEWIVLVEDFPNKARERNEIRS